MRVCNGVVLGQFQRAVVHTSISVAALLLASSALAGGEGGYGGGFRDPNWPGVGHSAGDSSTGNGGRGGDGLVSGGGAGGTPGNAGASVMGFGESGGGGGGGSGLVGTGSINSDIAGGAGGDGGSFGGGGGGGGAGLVVPDSIVPTTIHTGTTITGGAGGNGGSFGNGGGGGGGAGIFVTSPFGAAITVDGTVVGGNGGSTLFLSLVDGRGGAGEGGAMGADRNGNYAQGGAGIVGRDLTLTISGTVSGGLNGDGVTRADAIRFTGGSNTLTFMNATSGLVGDINIGHSDVTFEQATNVAILSRITGTGNVIKSGNGSVAFFGDSSAFAGSTDVTGGRLAVMGQLGGDVEVASGATLGGFGRVLGTVTVGTGGILAPGGSTLTVGALSFNAGSFYDVLVNPVGTETDKTVVTGTASLTGATVRHIGLKGPYRLDSTYRILEAATIVGTFDAVTSNYAFLDPELLYGATFVDLHLVRNNTDFAALAGTRNQIATGNGLETVNQYSAVYASFLYLPGDPTQVQHALNQLSGEAHATAHGVLISGSRFVTTGIADRLRAASGSVGASAAPVMTLGGGSNLGGPRDDNPALAGRASLGAPTAGGPDFAAATTQRFALWSQAFGAWGSSDSDGNAASVDRNVGGVLIGGDGRLADWRVGAFTGYGRTDFSSATVSSSGEADSYHLGAYAGRTWDRLALRTSLSHTWHEIDIDRRVAFDGFDERLEAGYDAGSTQAFAELGYALSSRGGFGLEAFANIAYVHFASDGFSETGGDAALSSSGDSNDVTSTTLGLRTAYALRLGTLHATARGSVGWRHAFGDLAPESRFAFSTGDSFVVAGTPLAEDAVAVEAGLDALLSSSTTLGITYNGEVSSDTREQGVKGDLRVRF